MSNEESNDSVKSPRALDSFNNNLCRLWVT